MSSLAEILLDASRRQQVLDDCVQLIDDEVRSKSGLSGIAVKGAYAIVKKIKPSIVRDIVDKLIEPFAQNLDQFYQSFKAAGITEPFAAFLLPKATPVANALLSITDERAQKSENRTLRSVYDKLRPTGVKHVEAAVPGIARLIAKHI